jgi:hypothetical protein
LPPAKGSVKYASCGSVAQLVEQETLNLLVVGSSPTRSTIQILA